MTAWSKTILKKIFSLRCASCHQSNGLGIATQYPPLAGSEWVSANPALITKIILKGLKGEITVKGEKYGTSAAVNMAAVPIDDREIANVVTYVRQAWGNDYGEMTTDEVATIRSDTVDQKDQWKRLLRQYRGVYRREQDASFPKFSL